MRCVIGTFGLLAPFGAYAIAEHLLGSGVRRRRRDGPLRRLQTSPRTELHDPSAGESALLALGRPAAWRASCSPTSGCSSRACSAISASESVGHILLLVRCRAAGRPGRAARSTSIRRAPGRTSRTAGSSNDGIAGVQSGEFEKRHRKSPAAGTTRPTSCAARSCATGWRGSSSLGRTVPSSPGRACAAWSPSRSAVAGRRPRDARRRSLARHRWWSPSSSPSARCLLQGLTLPLLIRSLGIAATPMRRKTKRRSPKCGRRAARPEEVPCREARRVGGEVRRGRPRCSSTRSRMRMTRSRRTPTRRRRVEDGREPPSYEDLVALSRGWLQVRREILLAERDAGNLDERGHARADRRDGCRGARARHPRRHPSAEPGLT